MYKVISGKAPYFKWRQNTIKAKDGTLSFGAQVDGSKFGVYLVLNTELPGEIPHAMYLSDLQDVSIEPPPVQEGAIITLKEVDGRIRIFKEVL